MLKRKQRKPENKIMARIEPGVYRAKCVGPIRLGLSSEKQTPYLTAMMQTDNGCNIQWSGFLTEGTVEKTVKALRLFGFKGKSLSECEGKTFANEVSITVDEEEYEGKKRMRIQWVNDLEYVPEPVADDTRKKIAKSLESYLK